MQDKPILNAPRRHNDMETASSSFAEKDIDTEILESEKKWNSHIKLGLMVVIATVAALLVIIYAGHLVVDGEWEKVEKFAIAVSSGIISSLSVSFFFKK